MSKILIFVLGFAFAVGSTLAATRPQKLTDDQRGWLLQEYCKVVLPNATVTGGGHITTFTHKVQRTQIIILRCASVEQIEDNCSVPEDQLL